MKHLVDSSQKQEEGNVMSPDLFNLQMEETSMTSYMLRTPSEDQIREALREVSKRKVLTEVMVITHTKKGKLETQQKQRIKKIG